jgi:hypothetical protein
VQALNHINVSATNVDRRMDLRLAVHEFEFLVRAKRRPKRRGE